MVSAYSETFSSSSYNLLNKTFNGKTPKQIADELNDKYNISWVTAAHVIDVIDEYREESKTKVTSFFGISNTAELKIVDNNLVYENFSVTQRFRQFYNWDENIGWQIFTPFKFIYSFLVTLHNCFRALTLWPLTYLAKATDEESRSLWKYVEHGFNELQLEDQLLMRPDSTRRSLFNKIMSGLWFSLVAITAIGLGTVSYALTALKLFVRCVIAPGDSIVASIYTGLDAGEAIVAYLFPHNENLQKYLGRYVLGFAIGGTLALVSLAITAGVYAATAGIAFAAAYAAGLSFAADGGISYISLLENLAEVFLTLSSEVVYPVLSYLGLTSIPPIGIAVFAFFGSIFSAAGTVFSSLVNGFGNETYYCCKKEGGEHTALLINTLHGKIPDKHSTMYRNANSLNNSDPLSRRTTTTIHEEGQELRGSVDHSHVDLNETLEEQPYSGIRVSLNSY